MKIELKNSECCEARLYNYDKNWDDGICSECNEHSPAIKEGGNKYHKTLSDVSPERR